MTDDRLEKDCRDCVQCFINFMGPWCTKSGKPERMSHSFWDDVRSCEDFTSATKETTGVCICGHPAEYHDRDGFCCGNYEEFKAIGPKGQSSCTCHEFRRREKYEHREDSRN